MEGSKYCYPHREQDPNFIEKTFVEQDSPEKSNVYIYYKYRILILILVITAFKLISYLLSIKTALLIIASLAIIIVQLFVSKDRLSIKCISFIAGFILIILSIINSIQTDKFESDIRGILTGGDSIAVISTSISKDLDLNEYLNFDVINEGNYPIHDLYINTCDTILINQLFRDAIFNKTPVTIDYLKKSEKTKKVDIPAHYSVPLFSEPMPSEINEREFNISYKTSNSEYMQLLHIVRNKEGGIRIDSQVVRDGETLYSIGDPNYFQNRKKQEDRNGMKTPWGRLRLKQNEQQLFMFIDGDWRAFDAKGRLIGQPGL